MAEHVVKRRSLTANSLFSVIAWLFPILLGFISTPIVVHGLGSEQYGIFAIVLGFISYSFTFGVGKVVGKYLPEYQASAETGKVTQVVAATFWFSLAIGLVGSLALIFTAPIIVRDLLLVSSANHQVAVYSLYLAGGIGLVLMLSQVFQFVLQGLHRFDNFVALTNLNGLLLGVGNIALALAGFGVVALLMWNLGVVSFVGIMFFFRARHLLPSIRFVTEIPREMLVSVIRYGGSIILYQIFANVLFIFERSWVMRKFGPEALTYYFVPMLLALYMHGFIFSIAQAIFPVVNELLEDRSQVIRLYERANKIVAAVVFFVVTNFIVCGSLFLELWIGREVAAASYTLLIAHGLTFGVIALGILAFQLAEAFKFPALNVIMTGSWMAISIPLMIVAADIWRSEGVAWSRFVAALVTIPIVIYTERRFLGQVRWKFWLATGLRVAAAAGLMAAAETGVLMLISHSYAALFLAGTAGTIVFAAVLVLTGYIGRDEWNTLRRTLSRSRSVDATAGIIE